MSKKLSTKSKQQKMLKRAERKRNQARQKEMDDAIARLCAIARERVASLEAEQ